MFIPSIFIRFLWSGKLRIYIPFKATSSISLELVFSGRMVNAKEALEIGLFDKVVPLADLETVTLEFAAQLAEKPPIAIALAKKAIYRSDHSTLEEALDLELENQLQCLKSEDAEEGLRAFLEKRSPDFKGA